MTYIGLSVDDAFLSALDLAVIEHRRENPERNVSRAAYMRAVLARPIEDNGISVAPKARVHHRETVPASVAA